MRRTGSSALGAGLVRPPTGEIDCIFGALADAARRDILGRAMRHEQSVSALARHYAISFASVQKHIAGLERATLFTKDRRGREQIVQANRVALATAVTLLEHDEQLWIHRRRPDHRHLRHSKGEIT